MLSSDSFGGKFANPAEEEEILEIMNSRLYSGHFCLCMKSEQSSMETVHLNNHFLNLDRM